MRQAPEREARQAEVAAEFRRHMARGAALGVKTVACPEAPLATLERIASGDKPLDVARLGAVYEQALTQDRAAAVALVNGILRAAGMSGSWVPDGMAESARSLLVEGAEAGVAVGEVQAAVLRAAADGVVSPDEAAEVRGAAAVASRELADVVVLAGRLMAQGQMALALGR